MSNVFVISDLHFSHEAVLRFCPEERPFKTTEQMNEVLIDNWNRTVTKRDTVWVLGDVSFAKTWEETADLLDQLKGNKNLILGNHDLRVPASKWLTKFRKVEPMRIVDNMILTHIPVHTSQLEFRWSHNVHGHLHNKVVMDDGHLSKPDIRYINVSCERTGLRPLAWEDMKKRNDVENYREWRRTQRQATLVP